MAGRFAVLGSGAWGTAIAIHLASKPGNEVRLWSARGLGVTAMTASRENGPLLPGVRIPESVTITADAGLATAKAECWIIAVPTAYLRSTLQRFPQFVTPGLRLVSLTKGIEVESLHRPSDILKEILGVPTVAVLSGPSHAEEVARVQPTSLVVASTDDAWTTQVQNEFGTDAFRVYATGDVIGVELAGALKNVIGIAAGVCDGLGFGDNAKSALLTRGVVEMTRFGVAHGAEAGTFAGLAGMGDLITTCFSRHGRNRRVGERLARGETLHDVLAGPQVAEGVNTAKSVHARSVQMGLDMPILAAVYDLLYRGRSPRDAVRDLMARQQRREDRV